MFEVQCFGRLNGLQFGRCVHQRVVGLSFRFYVFLVWLLDFTSMQPVITCYNYEKEEANSRYILFGTYYSVWYHKLDGYCIQFNAITRSKSSFPPEYFVSYVNQLIIIIWLYCKFNNRNCMYVSRAPTSMTGDERSSPGHTGCVAARKNKAYRQQVHLHCIVRFFAYLKSDFRNWN